MIITCDGGGNYLNMKNRIMLQPVQILAIGFGLIILIGGLILSTPLCSKSGEWAPYLNNLFTATSATCVTGLSVYDIYTHYNFFGQLIIILLIQTGGLGFMGFAMSFYFISGNKITIFQRTILMESLGTNHVGGVVKMIKRMLIGTLLFEGIGAVIMSFAFVPKLGTFNGIWSGIFVAISSFCNAGFDLNGQLKVSSSMTLFYDNPAILITIMVLIVTGGIGFIVWSDICDNKLNFRKYALHTKIMIVFTGLLILIGALLFMVLEWNNSFSSMSSGDKILNSFFASVTPRTAGFDTVDYSTMTTAGRFITITLMAIGAGTGSTGGGLKVTTFVTLALAMYSQAKSYQDLSIFKRRLQRSAQKDASSSLASYAVLIIVITFFLLIANPSFTAESCLFEAVSALSTVGLTMGLTAAAGWCTKLCLIFLMYMGRLGSIAVAMAFIKRKVIPNISYPEEKITIG